MAGDGTLRLFVWNDSLHLLVDDCGGYTSPPYGSPIDEWIDAPRDVASSGTFDFDGADFSGALMRYVTDGSYTVRITIAFEGEASELSGGFYQELDVRITEIGMDLMDDPDIWTYDDCDTYNIIEVTFYRVNPLWEP